MTTLRLSGCISSSDLSVGCRPLGVSTWTDTPVSCGRSQSQYPQCSPHLARGRRTPQGQAPPQVTRFPPPLHSHDRPVRIGRLCPLRASRIHDPSLLPATLPLTQAAHASCLAFHLFLVGAGLIVSGPGYRSFWAQRSRLCPPAASMPMPWPPPALRARRCSAHQAPAAAAPSRGLGSSPQPSLPGVLLRRLSFPDPCSSSTFFTLLAPAHSSRFN